MQSRKWCENVRFLTALSALTLTYKTQGRYVSLKEIFPKTATAKLMMTKMKKHQRQPNAVVVKLPIKGAINGPSTGPYKYAAKAYWWSSSDQMSAKVPAPTLRGAHPPKPPRKRRTQRTAVE